MKKVLKSIKYIFIVGLLMTTIPLTAKVSVPRFFSDNMVLQRGKTIVIWGNADKGESVKLSLNGLTTKVKTDRTGKWRAEFQPMTHGGPYQLAIAGKNNSIILKNVLIGDVWLCSGQSNMEFKLDGDKSAKQEIPMATNSNIRLLSIPKSIQTRPQDDIESGQWVMCNPENATRFSAVGYFFGKRLQRNLNVPIGLIDSSWGGTDIETWTSWDASMKNPQYAKFEGKSLEQALGFTMEDIYRFKNAMDGNKDIADKFYQTTDKWQTIDVPKAWDGTLSTEDGIVWFRKEIILDENSASQEAILNLGAIDDEDNTFVNGVEVGHIAFWLANRNYKIDKGILHPGKNIITVRVKDSGSIGGMIGSADQLYLQVGRTKISLAGVWEYKPYILSSQFGFKSYGYSPNSFASLLFNGMINPIVGYPITGVIWYQGENNSAKAYEYRKLFPNMIENWRSKWHDQFAFLWVQLASFMAIDTDKPSVQSDWAELREAQNMALDLPKTGQAVITDIGEAFDIHPRNKYDVGYRLARTAMNVAYGQIDTLASGPVYDKVEKHGNKLIVSFKSLTNKLTTSDKNRYKYVYGFTIAGENRKFVWAQAYISGDKVVVFSDEIANPVALRYGWCNNPIEINLTNDQGLLASPFRTDEWTDPCPQRQ